MQLSTTSKVNLACFATAAVGLVLTKANKPLGLTIFALGGVACLLYNLYFKKTEKEVEDNEPFALVDKDGGISLEEEKDSDGLVMIDLGAPLIDKKKNGDDEKNNAALAFILNIPSAIFHRLFQGQQVDRKLE